MFDSLIFEVDKALRTLFVAAPTARKCPGSRLPEVDLTAGEKVHAGALMRINHVGEVCAQALYQGQALACKDAGVREALKQAAWEETEHLAWTESRLRELGGRKSILNPLWYAGALSIGAVASRMGDRWSLGFLAETERQVEAHLAGHLEKLPVGDTRSRAIVEQMRTDEKNHAEMAVALGARELPVPVKHGMRLAARLMTLLAYRL